MAEQEPIGATIRVVLVDDYLAFRQPLAFMLQREPDITVIGQAGTVGEARPLLPLADIALIDLHLPDGDGISLLHELRSSAPQTIALVLTGDDSTAAMERAVEAGAAGVLHKSRPASEVVAAIRCLHAEKPLLKLRESIELPRQPSAGGTGPCRPRDDRPADAAGTGRAASPGTGAVRSRNG